MVEGYLSYRHWLEEHRPSYIELSVEQVVRLFEHSRSSNVKVANDGSLKIENIITGDVTFRHSIEFIVLYEPIIEGQKVVYWRPTITDYLHNLIGGLPGEQAIETWLGELGIHRIPAELELPEPIVWLPIPSWASSTTHPLFEKEAVRDAREFQRELAPYIMRNKNTIWHVIVFVACMLALSISVISIDLYFDQPILKFLIWLMGR